MRDSFDIASPGDFHSRFSELSTNKVGWNLHLESTITQDVSGSHIGISPSMQPALYSKLLKRSRPVPSEFSPRTIAD